jgi:Tfp pilus assembly protein PilF
MRWKLIAAVLSICLLPACAVTPPADTEGDSKPAPFRLPIPDTGLFEPTAPVPSPETLIGLTNEQEAHFLEYFYSESLERRPKHHRIRDFLYSRLDGFGYLEGSLTASQALDELRGNCVSLAALTLALADSVGVETRFQLMNTAPVFDRDGGLIISTNHVRSRIFDPDYEPTPGNLILQRPHVQIDYFPGDRRGSGEQVSREEFLALFYRNLAADALIAGDLDQSFALTRAALEIHPDQADSLNLMAVLHRRAGDPVTAEAYYRYATEIHGNRVDILSNHENLLRQLGRHAEANQIESRLARLDDPNPFHWLDLGERARQRGSLTRALQWYHEALNRAPYLHEAYWRLAIVYEELGQPQRSMAALEKARSLTRRPEMQENYQTKLNSLKAGHGGRSRRF